MNTETHDIRAGDYVHCIYGVCRVLKVWRDVWPHSYQIPDRSGQTRYVKPAGIYHLQPLRRQS